MIRFLFWVVPVSVPGVDLLFRFNQISKFQNLEILYYSVSILLSLILYWLLHDAIARTRKESTRVFLSITTGLFYSVCIVGTYAYFRITNIIPNLYTFSYMFEETYNSYTLARDSFSFLYLLLIFAVGAVFSSSIYFSAKSVLSPMHRILRYSQIVIAISVLLLLGNNVRFVDQIYVSDVNALSCFQRQATNLITGTKIGSFGLLSRNRIFLKDSYSGKKYNVLLIIGESLRRKNMSLYDYQRKTTPFLDQLRLTHRKEFFVFPKAFSNSGSTLLSVPSILTGITPVQDISLANSYPLFWEYAKAQKYSTFYITSHSHKWNNFQNFFSNADIDFLWNKEISNLPAFNDLGIDDRETVAVFQNRIKGFGKENKKFSGVLHLNTNHFPYYTPINYEKWPVFDNVINGYDNSVYYFDSLISRVFDSLKENSMMENTIVFITSDHGEAIFDHNYLGHIDNNYIETVSIPMMIYIPEKLQNNFSMAALEKNKDVNVFNSDIIPTMIDFWKIRETGEINKLGKNFTGTSLFRSIDPERKILIANNNPTSLYRVGFGLISGKMNYLVRINSTPKTEELYDFSRDPLEADNLWPKINDDTRRNYHRAVQDCIICRSLYDDAGIQFLEN